MRFKNGIVFGIFIFIILTSLSSVSAVTYSVDETWDDIMIHDLLDNSNDITGMHFTGDLGGI